MKRCAIMVNTSIYRAAGQCQKRHGLRMVNLIDQRISVCAHHRLVLRAGRKVELAR